ncbi:MAG TPA: patatin-like phospholipase family protein [Chloroflexia bacterium]|nr:patatin-like phospholipase family protein [Chloroflexia bacterium]
MAKKKVALVLSGGVSLGSYIAGALDELMRAFASSDEYEIDIITGASAGATTAAIIAHGLLYRGGETKLQDVWVNKVDILELLAEDMPAGETPSLLNSRRLREVAEETLKWEEDPANARRASFCAEELVVAMTLTNTSALPYVSRIKQPTADGDQEFVQYRHTEQETFRLSSDFLPTDAIWQRISTVARASAAIPFAFPMVKLTREAKNDRHYVQTPSFDGSADFWYCDGGTFNNLPIDLAWWYASQVGDLDERIFVIINPWRREVGSINKNPDPPNLLEYAVTLLSAMMLESSAIQLQNEVVFRSKQQRNQDAGVGLEAAMPGIDPAPVDVLGKFALVMPVAEGPGQKGRLRGNHMQALGAFLDQSFRMYDFRRGAADARQIALHRLNIPKYEAGPERPDSFYDPDADDGAKLDLTNYANLGKIPSARNPKLTVKQSFEKALEKRIRALFGAWNAPGPDFLTDPLVSRWLNNYVRGKLPDVWNM